MNTLKSTLTLFAILGLCFAFTACESKTEETNTAQKEEKSPQEANPSPKAPPKSAKAEAPAELVHQPGAKPGDRTICPVMGNEFVVSESSTFAEYEGQKVYFCCPGCQEDFAADPAGLLQALKAKIDAANGG